MGALPTHVRGDSAVAVAFAADGGTTHIARLHERGALRLRYARGEGRREAVLLNTGGGVAGGDRLSIDVALGASAHATVTTQAAERVYRTDGPPAQLEVSLRLGENARLDWLPQETMVFDRASAERTLDVEMAGTASLVLLETLVLGRIAHGERITALHWRDRWRIKRDGRLLLAEDVQLEGDAARLMERPATGGGARALGTLVHVAPDAEARLPAARDALGSATCLATCSAWNGALVARLASTEPQALRDAAMRLVQALGQRAMPRTWNC